MEKTERIKQIELLEEVVVNLKGSKVSFNIYGTSNEDAFLSGINDGIDRAIDVVTDFIEELKEHE